MLLQPMENPLGFSSETILRCPTIPWMMKKPGVIEKSQQNFGNGGAFPQPTRVNSPVDFNNSDIQDLIGAYILFDFSKKAHQDAIVEKQRQETEISTRSSVVRDLAFRVPKKQRSRRGKSLKDLANSAITGDGFLRKFGKSVIKASSKGKAPKLEIEGAEFKTLVSDLGQNRNLKRCRESGETEETANQKKPRRQKFDARAKLVEWGLEPPPNMPAEFKNLIEEIGGSDSEGKLLIQKIIYKTDLSEGHNRLQIPANQVTSDFLTEKEKREIGNGMDVLLIEPNRKVSKIQLTKWNMGNSEVIVFNKQWKSVVRGNKTLKHNSVVQIWSFRRGPESELGFAMVAVREGDD